MIRGILIILILNSLLSFAQESGMYNKNSTNSGNREMREKTNSTLNRITNKNNSSSKNDSLKNINNNYEYWINAGFWSKSFSENNICISYNFSFQKNYAQVSFLAKGGTSIFDGDLIPGDDGYSYNVVSFGYGKMYAARYYLLSSFIGPSFLWGRQRGENHDIRNYYSAGVNLNAQFTFRLVPEVGFGIGILGNLNFENSFSAIQITLHIGNLKYY